MARKRGAPRMSNAERVARWREKQRTSPRKHEEYKRKERERYQEKKKRGIVKSITEMTERERRSKRKQWRQSSNTYYNKKKIIFKAVEANITPPHSPDQIQNQPQRARQLGRKKVRRDRSKAYREIFKLRVALKKEERLKEKYKKRLQRQQKKRSTKTKTEETIIKGHDTRRALLLYSVIINRMKQRYRTTKKQSEKHKISSLVCATGLIKRYKLCDYVRKITGFTTYQLTSRPMNRKVSIKATRVKESVTTFLERDDNSRLKADKRATITRNHQKKQIRNLNDDMKHLHEKYSSEIGQRKISYSLFCKLRPFWVRSATAKDRETCLCKVHENLTYKLEAAYAEKMYSSKNINDIVKTVTFNNVLDNKECMYRTCNNCNTKTVPRNDEVQMGKQVTWKMWKNRRVTTQVRVVRENETGTLQSLDEEVNKEVHRAARHIYNIHHQYQSMAFLKENMNDDEILIHMDFSENYTCKLESEIQSMHFGASTRQVSLHTGIVYSKDGIWPFATVSDCLIHSPAGIWGHLQPIFESFKPVEKGKTVVHFLTDGPTTQYRNKINMYLFSTRIFDLGFRWGSWNYLEAGHGKGAANGIGAVIKRTGDKHVLAGNDIKCAADLKEALSGSSVNVYEVQESDIMAVDIPEVAKIRPVPQTMRLHQVLLQIQPNSPVPNITVEQTPRDDNPIDAEVQTVEPTDSGKALKKLITVDEHLIGRYIVVEYDGLPYPGEVLDVDEDDLEVKVMHKIGRNRFFWPLMSDILWYKKEHVVTLLEDEPQKVTGRHSQIHPDIWKLIEDTLDL